MMPKPPSRLDAESPYLLHRRDGEHEHAITVNLGRHHGTGEVAGNRVRRGRQESGMGCNCCSRISG